MRLLDRIKNSFNVFKNDDRERQPDVFSGFGATYSSRPDRKNYRRMATKDVTNSIFTRMSVDFANVDIRHVSEDAQGRYLKDVKSSLNECLTLEANIDQSAWHFRQDICHTMLEEGVVAIVPVDTTVDPEDTEAYDIQTMRVGTVVAWYPEKVRVRVFRQEKGQFEELTLPKSIVAIVENPFYNIMNEPNGTLKRLVHKMALMDVIDEQIGSGRLDVIIQLPYTVKSETKREQAERRRSDLESQLKDSNFGVAYTDGTERVIQLNRPMENNLVKNVEYLTGMLYGQLGITEDIMNGTASETTMLNYQSRTIKPLLKVVTEGIKRKFISKTARSQGQSIEFFQNPFELVPISQIADISDRLTRNAILSSNEMRQILGFKPVDDPMAEKLVNKNLPQPTDDSPIAEE